MINKLIVYVFFIFVSITLFFSCKYSNKKDNVNIYSCDSQIDSISIFYYNSLFKSFKGIKCEEITKAYIPDFVNENEGILYVVIKDCKILKEIEMEVLQLRESQDYPLEDIRIAATLYYKDKMIKRICISNMFAESIFLDGEIQEKNNKLLYLIKNNIGYYVWFGEPILEMMDELQDTSFIKEPFIESPYYKRYLEMNKDPLQKIE